MNPADYASRFLSNAQENKDGRYDEFYLNAEKILKKKQLRIDGNELFVMVKGVEKKIPNPLERKQLLEQHRIHHLHAKQWYSLVSRDVYYPGLFEDLVSTVKGCATCQKVVPYPQGKNWFRNLPTGPAMQLQLDHIGPFIDKKGNRFWILTVIDTFSGKAFATVAATTAIDEVLVFLQEVVFQTFIPKAIYGDKAFTYSSEFVKFCEYWSIKLLDAGPSRSQGMIECFNQILQLSWLNTEFTQSMETRKSSRQR